jgi:beta-lactamase class A
MHRRHLVLASALLPLPALARPAAALADLERRAGGRLGVALLDTATGTLQGHRLDERFGLCSTFKLLLAAAVLQRPDAEGLIRFGPADLLAHAPVVRARLAEGRMSAAELAEATQTTSDNAAANLLLRERFGGPAGFTAWLRAQGDATTRIDRMEPEMNLVPRARCATPAPRRPSRAPAPGCWWAAGWTRRRQPG